MNDSQPTTGQPFPSPTPTSDPAVPQPEEDTHPILAATDDPAPYRLVPPLSPPRPPHPLLQAWRRIGGGSLAASLLIHIGLLLSGGLIVFSTTQPEKQVDFLPGGSTPTGQQASQDLEHKVQQKRRSTLNQKPPAQRLLTNSLDSTFTLPDAPPSLLNLPDATALLTTSSLSSTVSGMRPAFTKNLSSSPLSGITFAPVSMFGLELKSTRRIAVVMDVSRSMTKYLPAVVTELDKIARQSTLILYFGCGLSQPKGRIEDKVLKVEGDPFARFWQNWQGKASVKLTPEERKALIYDSAKPMPLESIYKKLAGRPNTYFIDFHGIGHTQTALMATEVMSADTIYWFADFQDAVTPEAMTSVRRKLNYRKQKLIIHASRRGRSFDEIVEHLVTPLKGQVVEAEVKTAK